MVCAPPAPFEENREFSLVSTTEIHHFGQKDTRYEKKPNGQNRLSKKVLENYFVIFENMTKICIQSFSINFHFLVILFQKFCKPSEGISSNLMTFVYFFFTSATKVSASLILFNCDFPLKS